MSCGVGCRHRSDPKLLCLWRWSVVTAPIGPLAWEPLYAVGAAQEMAKRPKKKKRKEKKRKKEGGIHRAWWLSVSTRETEAMWTGEQRLYILLHGWCKVYWGGGWERIRRSGRRGCSGVRKAISGMLSWCLWDNASKCGALLRYLALTF